VTFSDFTIALGTNGKIVGFPLCPNLVDGQWHTIAFTHDGRSRSLYIDNAFVQTVASPNYRTQGDETNWLGAVFRSGRLTNKFVGDMKDIAFYNYALTAAQATTDSITE